MQKNQFDPYESTYVGHYKWPGELMLQNERRERVEQGVGTQCSPESFSIDYGVLANRTTVGTIIKVDVFESTTQPVPVPLIGYPPGKKYVRLRFGRPRPKRIGRGLAAVEYDATLPPGGDDDRAVVTVTEDTSPSAFYDYEPPDDTRCPHCQPQSCTEDATVEVISI